MRSELIQTFPLPFYTEGPAMDSEGNIYCTTLTGGTIEKFDINGTRSVWAKSVCPNGQVILSNGDHLVCNSSEVFITRYDQSGTFIKNELEETCNGLRVFVPNDLIVDRSGGIYFTDSIRGNGKVCYISSTGAGFIVAIGLDYPNGIALSADENRLYVAESYRNRIITISLSEPGIAAGTFEVFAELPIHSSGEAASNLPDGIALDANNNLWVAHYGMGAVQLLNTSGDLFESIAMPFPLVSNVFLSTENASEIIVTGGFAEPGPGALVQLLIKE